MEGNVKIEEMEDGALLCGVCRKPWKRIIGHLKNNIGCSKDIDIKQLQTDLSKFRARQRRATCDKKQKADNKDQFLKENAARRKLCDQKQRTNNKDQFLKVKSAGRKIREVKRKAENPEQFFKDNAKRNKKSDQKQKAENLQQFLDVQAARRRKCEVNKQNKIDARERLKKFRKATRFGPIFVCRCCERKLFEHQVSEVNIESFRAKTDEKYPELFSQCITFYSKSAASKNKPKSISSFDIDKKNFICRGCKISMGKGKMPKMCASNSLTVDHFPDNLKLTELENNLIAKIIIFQKLHKKPKSRWSGTHDRLVNVPIGDQDILNTVNNLPRTPSEAGIIIVSLKRKLEYKNTHTEQLINTKKIYKYLHYLKNVGNKFYQFFDNLSEFLQRCKEKDPEGLMLIHPEEDNLAENLVSCIEKQEPEDEIDNETDSETEQEKEDLEYRTKDPVRKQQFDYDQSTCMTRRFPEAIPDNDMMAFAPGEGKVPTNILKEEDWDVKAFPNLHPTGTNGLHESREIKNLTDQQYFEKGLKTKTTGLSSAPHMYLQ